MMALKAFCQAHQMPVSQALQLPLSDLEMWAVFNCIDADGLEKRKTPAKPSFSVDNYKHFIKVKQDG